MYYNIKFFGGFFFCKGSLEDFFDIGKKLRNNIYNFLRKR